MNHRKIFAALTILALGTALMILPSCGSNSSPSSPGTQATATPNATATTVPGFYWKIAQVSRSNYLGSPSQVANVSLLVNGQQSATVLVVLTGSGLGSPVTLPYYGPVTTSGVAYSAYQLGGISYVPGQTYTLTTTSGSYVASSTLIAPGNITHAANGASVTFSVGGSQNLVQVNQASTITYNSTTYIPSITSPFSLPVSAYSGGGTFTLGTTCDNSTGTVSGTSYAFYIIEDSLTTGVTLATATPTPSFTSTSSYTHTLTPSPVFTQTYTSTSTYSFTVTPSPTFTLPAGTNTDTPLPTSTHTFTYTSTPSYTPTPTSTSTWTSIPTPVFTNSWPATIYGQGLAYSSASGGIVYVTDISDSVILRYTKTGSPLSTFGAPGTQAGQFNHPETAAADSSGNIYVADATNNRIQMLNATGTPVWSVPSCCVTAAGNAVSQFDFPTGVCLGGSGDIWVVDNNNSRIVELNATTGAWMTQWSGSGGNNVVYPWGVGFDSAHSRVYVADSFLSKVFSFDTSGTYVTSWGSVGSGPGQFQDPVAIMTDPTGNKVYVCDSGNNNIQIFDPNGNVLNIWGSYGSGNYQFGSSRDSYSPEGFALDGSGNLYVDDPSNGSNGLVKVYGP